MSGDPNRLLFVISARGSMTWKHYCDAVDFLSASLPTKNIITAGNVNRSGLLQCIEALGHCDVFYENGQSTINVAPPAFCRLPRSGLPVAVLAGARCAQTQRQVAKAAKETGSAVTICIEHNTGSFGLLPDTILVNSESEDAMKGFCAEMQIHYSSVPPAWTLVNWCGMLSEYEAVLDYRIPDTLDWLRYDFNVDFQRFAHTVTDRYPRYSRYLNPTTGLPIHVFFPDKLGAEVDLTWGRYLLLNVLGLTVTAYDERRYKLCVPVRIPLPAVIARAVCLCSGKSPVHRSNEFLVEGFNCQDWLVYGDVPPQIAMVALSKVGQNPARIEIK